ncbi:MAG: gliding motility-associated C-terminal domain-containing protein [Bacteroidia bacterium]|nr:gliding motility-associated C-terminal domain-containing protein [Bacteroidia bacterium]
MIKKIFIVAVVFVGSIYGFAQEKNASITQIAFDEAACRAEAIKAGILETELDGYVEYRKQLFYYVQEQKSRPVVNSIPDAQNPFADDPCLNTDFEAQNFSTWEADTGSINSITDIATYGAGFSNVGVNASVRDRLAQHTIMTTKPAVKVLPVPPPYTGYDERLDFVDKVMPIDSAVTYISPDGNNVSVRLGNAVSGGKTERLKKTFIVDKNSSAFTYSYAAILQNPTAHSATEQARFTVRLLDSIGNQLPGPCSFYEVYAGKDSSYISLNDTMCTKSLFSGTFTCTNTNFNYKTWTTVGVDLSAYMTQKITVEFTTRDCSLSGHFGYAYIDAKCSTFDIKSSFCPGEKKVKLMAPAGYVSYLWKDPAGNVIGNQQSVEVNSPKLGDVYTVQIVSVTGCQTLLKSIIERDPPPIMPSYEITQNIITPNGDGKNDLFRTNQFDYIGSFNIEIYNRWGLRVFESSDPTKEWDGKSNGKDVDDGIYYWIAKYQSTCFEDPKDVLSKGFVHVLR